ncbi:flavin reductase family protein [Citricoccus sp. GCM10030269]|uniref:flavin reductase family protein n=1 Tax=Citricoccus sp. GCM10030269 TaxID=3273388 RepID=UPI00361FD269
MTARSLEHRGLEQVDSGRFREVVGHFATGVTVISTRLGERSFGTTASSVASLSVDPPMMLACLNRGSATHGAVSQTGRFAVNVLSTDQAGLARAFAQKGDDKFQGVAHALGAQGMPLLDGALAALECEVTEVATGGTHTVFMGRVLSAEARPGRPLAYFRGQLGTLHPDLETAAVAAVAAGQDAAGVRTASAR